MFIISSMNSVLDWWHSYERAWFQDVVGTGAAIIPNKMRQSGRWLSVSDNQIYDTGGFGRNCGTPTPARLAVS